MIAQSLAVTLGVGLLVWIFSVVFFAPPKASGDVSGLLAKDNYTAVVKGAITKPIDREAICGIAARNSNLSIVGYVEFTAPAGERTVPFAVTVKTTELAGSGVVTDCRLN